MPGKLIEEVIASFGDAALRMKRAGLDGVEVVSAFGYLPAHFLNPRTNTRTDEYGGSFENRLRFLRRVLQDIREKVGDGLAIGARLPGDEMDYDGLTPDEMLEICAALDADGIIDYFNLGSGSDTSFAGWAAAVPPAPFPAGLLAKVGGRLKQRVRTPIIVAGRITDPRLAESIVAGGQADLVGLARALICDPEFASKAREGRGEDIRACIGCNQACIGHREVGFKVSCIQHPETGRERRYLRKSPVARPRKVLVAGGGPAGMKAAAVAAERGHAVTLCERSPRLGGQVRLAELLPGRAEFGGLITNLERELQRAQVQVRRNTTVTPRLVLDERPDAVVVATGSSPRKPAFEGADSTMVVDAWEVIAGRARVGRSVVVADWRCDWVGLGIAEKLAREGCRVRLCAQGLAPGETIQSMVRDRWVGDLHRLGVETIPYVRLYGADEEAVYFQHVTSGEPVICEEVDTLVLALAQRSEEELAEALEPLGVEVIAIGDCLAPRTAEEAVFEGMEAGFAL
jgi:NADPH-dependent 2,4-dienoyl-CoA reductase/sulfur reductase-like enzyme